GVQFVELDSKGARKSGIFFKEYNGKENGNLTQARSNSKSLMDQEPEQVWDALEKSLIEKATAYVNAKFEALPNRTPRENECTRCRVADLCGFRRLIPQETMESE